MRTTDPSTICLLTLHEYDDGNIDFEEPMIWELESEEYSGICDDATTLYIETIGLEDAVFSRRSGGNNAIESYRFEYQPAEENGNASISLLKARMGTGESD